MSQCLSSLLLHLYLCSYVGKHTRMLKTYLVISVPYPTETRKKHLGEEGRKEEGNIINDSIGVCWGLTNSN